MQRTSSPHAYELVVPPGIRRKTRLRWRLFGLAALVVAGSAVGLVIARPWRAPPPAFRTTTLETRNLVQVVEATGKLNVVRRTDVPAPAPGSLVESLVSEGTTVKQGQPLAQLDERAAEIALRSASAALESAKSHERQARAANAGAQDVLARTLRLSARGLASDSEVGSAKLAAATARAGVAGARAERDVAVENLAQAKLARTQRTLLAPVGGVVLAAPDSLGAMVAPEQGPLFVIGSALDSLKIDAWVAEADIGGVHVGQRATFTVPAYPDHRFNAKVKSIGVDASQRGNAVRYLVTLDAKNDGGRLLPGMTATLRIAVARADKVLSVREAALRFNPDGSSTDRSRLWRIDASGKPESVQVTPGVTDGAYTEVSGAHGDTLAAGERIVVGRALPAGSDDRGPGISLGGH